MLNRSTTTPTALTASASQPPGAPGCPPSALAVRLADGAGGVAGYPVDFTNQSGQACALRGYPSVAAYDLRAEGYVQVGAPARADPRAAPRPVVLRPGGTAHATVTSAPAAAPACHRVPVTGLRVIPPGTSTPDYLRVRFSACSVAGPAAPPGLNVQAVQPGPGPVAVTAPASNAR
ncbi:MAG TPA: DUF4232 domain-containing protein [Trebonia sp.]|nr:DUF4232 domain-containing protein [Trebonia sp.]